MAADVVGYTRLIRNDEEGTLARFRLLRETLVDPDLARFGGRVVKLMGDGILVEFASVVDAVRSAIAIQTALSQHNEDVPEEKRIEFRIGVNLGDIVIDGDDIQGDGVNLAARLEGLADPGGILISEGVHEQVRDREGMTFESLGERMLKNIDRPVRVWRWQNSAPGTPAVNPGKKEKPAIAVLPFDNMSADPEQEYFSDGLCEDIITALTYWRSYPVIARNSSFAYKGKSVDIKQVARELGARYILEGSVRKGGNRVRINAQLIDGSNGHHLWAERFDRELDDIFEVQDEIVQRIAALVAPELAKAELERAMRKSTVEYDAWDLYMQGVAALHERTRDGNIRARDLFARALEIQPDYSDAYAGIAMANNWDVIDGNAEDPVAAATAAMNAARTAIKHDDASSWAHHELSTAYQLLNRPDDALAEARISVDLNPNDAYALHALGNKSDLAGDSQGIARMEKAQSLNPEDAQSHIHLTFLARAYVAAGQYGEAVSRARQAIRRRPNYAPAHYILAIALAHLGELEEGRAELAACDEVTPGFLQSRENWQPYTNPDSNEAFQGGLRMLRG